MSFFARLLGIAWGRRPSSPLGARVPPEMQPVAQHNARGIACVRSGDRTGAVEAFLAAIEANPSYVPTIVNIGNLLLEDGVLDDAVVHYEAALRLDDAYPGAHLNLGIAYKKLGRRAESVRHLRKAHWLEGRLKHRR